MFIRANLVALQLNHMMLNRPSNHTNSLKNGVPIDMRPPTGQDEDLENLSYSGMDRKHINHNFSRLSTAKPASTKIKLMKEISILICLVWWTCLIPIC